MLQLSLNCKRFSSGMFQYSFSMLHMPLCISECWQMFAKIWKRNQGLLVPDQTTNHFQTSVLGLQVFSRPGTAQNQSFILRRGDEVQSIARSILFQQRSLGQAKQFQLAFREGMDMRHGDMVQYTLYTVYSIIHNEMTWSRETWLSLNSLRV